MAETPNGTACIHCGRTWLDMLEQREFWQAGERGIACQGGLTDKEVKELEAEVERIWKTLAA